MTSGCVTAATGPDRRWQREAGILRDGSTSTTPKALPTICAHAARRRARRSSRAAKASTGAGTRSEEHTSELQSLMRISYAVFCLKKKNDDMSDMKENNILRNNI